MSTTKFDRSKFKPTQVAAMKQADKDVEAVVKNRDASAGFIDIKKDGSHKLRIYPPHPDGGGNLFVETKVVNWLKVSVPERDKEGNIVNDSKNGKAKMKIGSKPIFNSKVHGDTEKDVVEEYIKFAEKIAKENYPGDEKAQKEFLEPIYGGYNSKHDGIMPRTSWVMYVDKITDGSKAFGRVEIGKAVKQRLNAISASEGSNDPLGTDPFTDIVDGRAVIITYDSKATRSQDFYTTEIDSSFDKDTKMVNLYPLSDTDLDNFMKYPSLHSMFKNAYKKKDFDFAMEGLKNLDDEHKLGVFQYEEFLDICEEISNYYPEEEQTAKADGSDIEAKFTDKRKPAAVAQKEVKGTKPAAKAIVKKEEVIEREPDAFDDMERDELKEFCRDNRTGIIVSNKMSEDDIRAKLRTWFQETQTTTSEETEEVEEQEEEEIQEEEEQEETASEKDDLPFDVDPKTATGKKVDTKDRIAQIRKNLGKG